VQLPEAVAGLLLLTAAALVFAMRVTEAIEALPQWNLEDFCMMRLKGPAERAAFMRPMRGQEAIGVSLGRGYGIFSTVQPEIWE
jgi:hypothetical protein